MVAMWKFDHINWFETQLKHKYKEKSELNEKSAIICNCYVCNQPTVCTTIASMRVRASQKKKQAKYQPICKSCQQKRTWTNPNFRKKQSIAQSKAMKKVWENDGYRKNQTTKHSKISKELWEDLEYKKKVAKGVAQAHQNIDGYTDKVVQALHSADDKRRKNLDVKRQSPDYKRKLQNAAKANWANPKYKAKMDAIHASLEYRTKLSKASKKLWENPKYAKKVMANQHSKLEDHLAAVLSDSGITYKQQYHIGYWPFDFMVPHSPKNILIEVQGDYWHGTKVDYNRSRDQAKATYIDRYCSNEYELHTIWEHEFLTPQRIIDKIETMFGFANIVDFKFSNCVVKTTNANDANLFFSKYHYIASGGRQGRNIGTFLNGELVACARFCTPTRAESATRLGLNQNEVAELTRFAIKSGYNKKNFASWCLSRCEKFLYDKKCCLTFADSTYGHVGTIYKATNWLYDGTINPDYFYIDHEGYVMHKRTLWGHAKKMSMSESRYCEDFGYIKKWGKEKYRFIKWLNK